jgi:NDP-sugar pyrophosphorylase family protein
MKAIVLAAGFGTRLGTLTQEVPKGMLPLCGKPLLERIIEYLAGQGITELAINLHFRPQTIQDHFGDGSRFGVNIHYAYEPQLLGTAGAIKNFEPWVADTEAFLVIYGDILTDQELAPVWRAQEAASALAALVLHKRPASNSIITIDEQNRITGFLERPEEEQRRQFGGAETWVNSGIQVLSRSVLDLIPADGPRDLPQDVYVPYHATHTMVGVPLTGFRLAIDSAERYEAAQEAVRTGRWRANRKPI